MSEELRFRREAVGVVSSDNWRDADVLNGVTQGFHDPIYTTPSVVGALRVEGSKHLSGVVVEYLTVAQTYSRELSDAAAVLGSGTENAIEDFDESEAMSVARYRELRERLGQTAMGDD